MFSKCDYFFGFFYKDICKIGICKNFINVTRFEYKISSNDPLKYKQTLKFESPEGSFEIFTKNIDQLKKINVS